MKAGITFSNVGRFRKPEHAVALARAAEASGFDSLWAVDHVLIPSEYESKYPYDEGGKMAGDFSAPIPDPIVWLTWAAAHTERLKVATGMLVLPMRDPAVVAKQMATLDLLSQGRACLGIGIGWLEEEFDALGVEFKNRGKRLEEYVRAMRALWAEDHVDFDGDYVRWHRVNSNPKPVDQHIPVVLGGHSRPAIERAGRIADGFAPPKGDLKEMLTILRDAADAAGRDPLAIEISTSHPGLHGSDPKAAVEELASLGVDRVWLGSAAISRDVDASLAEWAEKLGL